MDGPKYDGLIEQWKVELIERCARRMGFPHHEIDDLQQEIVPELLAFKYEDAKSNGAKESTVLQALVMNQLRKRRRGRARDHAKITRYKQTVPRSETTDDIAFQRKLDIRDAVTDLQPREQHICRYLAQGDSIEAIRQQLGCGWHAVDRVVRHLRDRFRELELDWWLGE